MNQYWKLRMRSLMIGFAVAVLPVVGPAIQDAAAATLPKDPCGLLKPAEIQAALAPNASIGSGVPATDMLLVECKYSWGPRTSEWGEPSVTIVVLDTSKAYQGTSPDLIQEGVLMKAKTGGVNASQIPDIGDAAVFTFETRSSNATAETYFKAKNVHLSVTFHGGDALQNKEKLIALLKEAAARI